MDKYFSSNVSFGASDQNKEKIIVDAETSGEVTIDTITGAVVVVNEVDRDSLNPVSSAAVANAIIQAGAELPPRGQGDVGKVLTVSDAEGDIEWQVPEKELPNMAGQDGKVLGAVDNNGSMTAAWVNPPDGIPARTPSDAGKVLGVTDTSGNLGWVTENDTTYTAGEGLSLNGTEFSVDNPLPEATSADNGKFLKVVDAQGTVEWQPQEHELPTLTGQGGKVLKVNSAGNAVEWATDKDTTYTAGSNVTISDQGVISATDTTYNFSTGLTNNSGTISVSKPVPSTQSSDSGKVLGVTDTAGTLGWVNQTEGVSVDQVYNSASTNAQSGVAVAEAISAVKQVPVATSSDADKVLTVVDGNGNVDWADVPKELPSISGNASKVLKVNAGGTAVEWADDTNTQYTFSTGLTESSGTVTVTNPVPSYSTTEDGKVLGVVELNGSASLEWISQSTGPVIGTVTV